LLQHNILFGKKNIGQTVPAAGSVLVLVKAFRISYSAIALAEFIAFVSIDYAFWCAILQFVTIFVS
jgi:hypothetical protein